MAVYLYEKAIVEKMRQITNDDRIIITPSDNIYNIIPRISNDELKLPLIHLVRQPWKLADIKPHGMIYNGSVNDRFPMYKHGDYIDCSDGKVHRMHAIPIVMSHVFEVWSRTREENDELIRELIWFLKTNNEFYVDIPYGVNDKHIFTLQIASDIMDNTDIVSHKDTGELFMQSFITICNDAYLWKSSSHNPTCINVGFEIKELKHEIIQAQDYNELTEEQR